MHEVDKVPPGHRLQGEAIHIIWNSTDKLNIIMNKRFGFTCVAFPEELHSHDSKDEDDDTEDEGEVTKSTNSFPHDGDQKVECWPRLCQFKHSELGGIMPLTLRIKPPVICGD